MVYSEGDTSKNRLRSPRTTPRPRARRKPENRSRSPPVLHVPSIDRLPKRKRAETPSFPIDERFTRCELHDLARLRLGGGRLFLDLLYGFH